jgi:dienelactone hydrolase
LAIPKTAEKRPGVLVVHEWWGLDAYPKKRADMLAQQGFVAFALDMYGRGKTVDTPDAAGALAGKSKKNMTEAQGKFEKNYRTWCFKSQSN